MREVRTFKPRLPRFTAPGKLNGAGVMGHTSAKNMDPHEGKELNKDAGTDCFSTGSSVVCSGKIEGNHVEMLVDTGSVFTIISENLWNALYFKPNRGDRYMCAAGGSTNVPGRPTLVKEHHKVVSANGEPIEILGRTQLNISVGNQVIKQSVLVAKDLAQECILGVDFMGTHGLIIDFSTMTLKTKSESVCLKKGIENLACNIKSARTEVIPAGHEKIIDGMLVVKHSGNISKTNYVGMVESTLKPKNDRSLLVARSIVTARNSTVPLRIANFSDEDVTIYKNTRLGKFSSIEENFESVLSNVCCTASGSQETTSIIDNIHIDSSLDAEQRGKLKSLLNEYSSIFSRGTADLGRTSLVKHHIDTGSNTPVRQGVRRVPIHKQREIKEHIDNMLQEGIIQPSCSPWAAPVILVPKKDGSTRFCIDYRRINAITKKDAYPLPRIDQTLDALATAKLFSSLDLTSGYWQIELDSESREKSAFTTNWGLYEFNVMPFGLCGAPSTFQRLMETVLAGLQWDLCLVYLDDIIIFSQSFDEHLVRLKEVFERIRKANLKLKPSKCHLLKSKITCLGHIISQQGIEPDDTKIEAVKNWRTPTSATEIQQFLGFASYYRRFVANFSEIAAPLYKLTQQNTQFIWSERCQHAFLELKRRLTTAPILALPRSDCEFIVDTDASDFAIGAVLSQIQQGKEVVIAYSSRTLSKSERNYCTTRKELLALVFFIKQFRHYLYGKKFLARTDHKALKWLFSIKDPEGQTARWVTQLSEYDFSIEHREGKRHRNADGMSRIPCRQCDVDENKTACVMKAEKNHLSHPTEVNNNMSGGSGAAGCSSRITCPSKPTGDSSLGSSYLRSQQEEDSDIKTVLSWGIGSKRPTFRDIEGQSPAVKDLWSKFDKLVLRNGVLYIEWEDDQKAEVTLKLVVPWKSVNEILFGLHSSPTGGHLGVSKTLGKVAERFYWFGMRRDVENYVANCMECVTRKNPNRTAKAPLQPHYSGAPFEKIAIDILEVPVSDKGNKYIVVIGDYFSKWAEAFPVKTHTAQVVAEILIDQFISRFGAPAQLHSDQGPEFESRLISELCRLLNIDKTRTTAYHPQSDGQVERFNRTLLSMLSKYVSENQRDWDVHLQKVMMGYRTSKHESTKFTPAYILFGRELRLPLDVQYELPDNSSSKYYSEYVLNAKERFLRAYETVRDNISHAQKTMKDYYDRKAYGEEFSVGDRVWYFDPRVKKGRSTKLNRPWKGPYIVKKKISDLVYRIQLEGTRVRKVVHFNKLKKCCQNMHETGDRIVGNKRGLQPSVNAGNDADDVDDDDDRDTEPATSSRGDAHIEFPITPPETPRNGHREYIGLYSEDEDDIGQHSDHGGRRTDESSEEEFEDANTDFRTPTPEENSTTHNDHRESAESGLRRSARNKKNPKYLNDFVSGDDYD